MIEDLEEINVITGLIVDAAVRIHREWGPGLRESVYEGMLARDLKTAGVRVVRQKRISFEYRGMRFDKAFRPDLIVEDTVIVEIKAASFTRPDFIRQLMTYLKVCDRRVGLLLNFGMPLMKDGIHRLINGY